MINSNEIVQYLHNMTKQSTEELQAQLSDVPAEEKDMAKATFQEIISTHVDLIKFFQFVELLEQNNNDLSHMKEIISEHLLNIEKSLEQFAEDSKEYSNVLYSKRMWMEIDSKFDSYVKLMNPLEQ